MAHTHIFAPFVQPVVIGVQSKRMTTSGYVHIGPGYLGGIFISSCSKAGPTNPTITFYNGVEAPEGEAIVGTFEPAAPFYYHVPVTFSKGLWIVITGNVDCSLIYI